MKQPRLRRRQVLQAGMAGTLGGLLPASLQGATDPAVRPNIVFIMADDMGYADAGCFGSRFIRTPHLDRLAAQGVRMTDCYANSPVCSPTRLALHTGLYQYRFPAGMVEPFNPGPWGDGAIPDGQPTMQGMLREGGYATHLVGKWHLGASPAAMPTSHGFDSHYGILGGSTDYFTHESRRDPQALQRNGVAVDDPGYLTTLLEREAIRLIEADTQAGRPFLLCLHFTAPHWPWEAPDDFGGETQFSNYETGSLGTFQAMVEAMDASIGEVMRALERQGITDDTLVVFTSDNGGERFSDAWPFRGMKGALVEGGIRVPTIVRYPRVLPRGIDSDQPALTIDWMPTFLQAAGIAAPQVRLDGMPLLPLLATGTTIERTLFWRFQGHNQRAVRQGRWKYYRLDGHDFLFDLLEDAHERANRALAQPDILARLRTAWETWNADMISDEEFPGLCFDTADLAEPLDTGPGTNCKVSPG